MEADNASFADLFDQESTQKLRHLTPGQKVAATIVGISGETVFLDVGTKSEGILNTSEITDSEGTLTAQVGDRLEVYYLQAKGAEQLFTAKVGSGSSAAHLEEAWRSNIPVEGHVKAEIKGGFEITLGGNVRAFCPYSQMGLRRLENPAEEYLDQQLTFRITRYEEHGRNIVVSARAIQEEERKEKREQLKQTLAEGDTVEGEITSIRDFGAFVDIGGVDGLIPISEIGWSRVERVADFFTVGQRVTTIIKKLDWDNDRIALSYKETLADPWEQVATTFPEGSSHRGTVARLTQFGAFVTLGPGIDGLIHISKLGGGRRIHHPREVLEEGQDVDVKIESIDLKERRISLAPAEYVSPEDQQETEQAEYAKYQHKQQPATQSGKKSMGSLGELLQARMAEKSKKK